MEKKDYNALKTAKRALDAWQRGEFTGDYSEFKKRLSPDFGLFAHPIKGRTIGEGARESFMELMREREDERNSLTFSSITSFITGKRVGFQFDVKGSIKEGKHAYDSYHLIVFEVDDINDVITGFSEYFGTVDKNWL